MLLADLEAERYLALLFVHALVGQPAKEHFVGGVVGIDGYANASDDGKGVAIDGDRLAEGACDAGGAAIGDGLYRLVAGQVSCNDDELVATEAR